jgi:hypothetical protein
VEHTVRRSLLVVLVVSLVVAGCGASRPAKPAGKALAALIHADGGSWAGATVTCVGRRSCTITWHDRVWWDRSDWLGAFPEVVGVGTDDRYASLRRFTVRIVDPRSRRAVSFACARPHENVLPHGAARRMTGQLEPRDLGCVETRRTL